MAKTKTTYSSHPKLVQICAIILTALTAVSIIAFVTSGRLRDLESPYLFSLLVPLLVLGAEFIYLSSGWIEINDDDRTLTVSTDRKHPVDITKVDRIVRHLDRKGRVRYITVHEAGVRYVDVRIRRGSEQEILENLRKINSKIETVSHND